MKVHLNISAQNSADWERVLAKGYDRPAAQPDGRFVDEAMALGELAEPLGFDGVWVPEHFGTPYVMTPNPLQTLTWFAARSESKTRPEGMSDIEWLVALEEIRQLKARRDRYVDAHDWDG